MSKQVIFLVGFMGAGKSRTGKKLAKALNLPFLDSDIELKRQTQKSIEEIFDEQGEKYFRELEKNWLNQLKDESAVIAVGGGLPCYYNNMERMNEMGLTIYLKLSVEALADRLKNAKTVRPLIESYKDDESALKAFIGSKMNEREPFYSQAKLQLSGVSLSAKRFADLVLEIKKLL